MATATNIVTFGIAGTLAGLAAATDIEQSPNKTGIATQTQNACENHVWPNIPENCLLTIDGNDADIEVRVVGQI